MPDKSTNTRVVVEYSLEEIQEALALDEKPLAVYMQNDKVVFVVGSVYE